jgi:hypothetical protein
MTRLRRYWLLAVPVIWLGVLILVMRPGALDIRENVRFEFSLLFYDPADIAAFVLRGANASMGREPGRRDEPKWDEPEDIAARLNAPPLPLADKYYLEYPSATLALFRLGFPQPCEMPAAVADSHRYGVAHFEPRNESERRIWSKFHTAAVIHVVLMAAALIGLMLVLLRGYEPGQPPGAVWLAALPGAVFFALNRFDIVPALATALAFACLGRGRPGRSGVWMAAGVLLKVYPVLFVPIVLRYLGPKRGAIWLAGFAGTLLAGVGLSWAVLGWEPTIRPVLVQLSRPLEETSWTLYGRLLPMELGHMKNARLGILAAFGLVLVLTRPAGLAGVLRRCAILLTVFVALAVFWSPQWIVWYLPLIVPLTARHRWLIIAAALLDLINYFEFPVLFSILWSLYDGKALREFTGSLIFVRAGLWLWLAGGLARCDWRSRRRASAISAPSASVR